MAFRAAGSVGLTQAGLDRDIETAAGPPPRVIPCFSHTHLCSDLICAALSCGGYWCCFKNVLPGLVEAWKRGYRGGRDDVRELCSTGSVAVPVPSYLWEPASPTGPSWGCTLTALVVLPYRLRECLWCCHGDLVMVI